MAIIEVGQAAAEVQLSANPGELKNSEGETVIVITNDQEVGIGTLTPASTLEVRGTTGERALQDGSLVPTQISLSYDATHKATIGVDPGGELSIWPDDCMVHIRSDDTCTYLQLQNSTTDYWNSINHGLSIGQQGDNAIIRNTEPAGTLELHSGTHGSTNLALKINSNGEITVLGSDTPVLDDVLSWDGSKAVWEPPASGSITIQVAANVDVTATVDTMIVVASNTDPVTVTLPAVAGNAGKFVIVKARHGDAFTVTVDGDGADIDGNPDQTLTSAMASIEMICDGAEWWIR